MKTCRKCGRQIEDDALVCPYCGCVNRDKKNGRTEPEITRISGGSEPPKKRKTCLWVLGWLFIFPLPLTILLLRNQKMNKTVKFLIIAAAWAFYLLFASAFRDDDESRSVNTTESVKTEEPEEAEEAAGSIKELEFSNTEDITVRVGKSSSNGYLNVTVNKGKDFSPDDVVFVSEDPEVAVISLTKDMGKKLYYEVTGVDGGETNVHAESKDGTVRSDSIHVTVPEPIRVESIEISGIDKTDLAVKETLRTKVSISPSDAEDKTITWTSSDESVATVDEYGIVTAVGGGEATITASSSNDVESSFDVHVDGSQTLMNVRAKSHREDDANIGDEWSYVHLIDGEKFSGTYGVSVGETLELSAKMTESDDNPDIGSGSTSHTVTEDDIAEGFEESFDVYVTENGGRNSGQSAHFVVTFEFTPVE